jgi:hypothetical protein
MSVWNFVQASGFPISDEKYTDAGIALISASVPACWHACFTICLVFWRGALIAV